MTKPSPKHLGSSTSQQRGMDALEVLPGAGEASPGATEVPASDPDACVWVLMLDELLAPICLRGGEETLPTKLDPAQNHSEGNREPAAAATEALRLGTRFAGKLL